MKVLVAKNAGFCFGVRRAVDAVEECLRQGPVYTFGDIIHNASVVEELKAKGAQPVDTLEVPAGSRLIIRAHGVPPQVYEACEKGGIEIVDATCPFVKRIHQTVSDYRKNGYDIIIAGKPCHHEVVGICGWAGEGAVVLEDVEEAKAFALRIGRREKGCMVAQTTMQPAKFQEIMDAVRDVYEDFVAVNTICQTTIERQEEAAALAAESDVVVVIGGKHSANTLNLARICEKMCKNVKMIEKPDELLLEIYMKDDIITSVVAGASTPDWMIREVVAKMTEFEKENPEITQEDTTGLNETAQVEQPIQQEDTAAVETAQEESEPAEVVEAAETEASSEQASETDEEKEPVEEASETEGEKEPVEETSQAVVEEDAESQESFADAFEKTMNRIRNGQIIKGTVVQIVNGEVSVNIGYKSDGYIPKSEFSADQDVNPEDSVAVGDEIEVSVLKVNDGEGNVLLSKKAVDARKAWDEIVADAEKDTVFETVITDAVKGGVIAYIRGVQAFIPASQASDRYVENLEELKGKTVRACIIEVDKGKRRIIASVRKVLKQEGERKKKELFETLEVGTLVQGIVRRITDFGAFVDIGGVDGLLHVTDLAWSRVSHPSDVVSIGEELELEVLAVDKEKERVSLGLKQTLPHPWDTAHERYSEGDTIEGKVVRIGSFGAFVALEPGIDGLIHISQVAPRRIEKVEDELSVGDVVTVRVLNVDSERHRISLSRRAVLAEEARKNAPQQYEETPAPKRERAEREPRVEVPPVVRSTVTLADFFPPMDDILNDDEDE
ncbi:MAG: bifunctional 4-hydroxy-3-methylbut-2-enyl diphosphate reductase/30S ribosomal protein S1 [Christensenellales bacterium]